MKIKHIAAVLSVLGVTAALPAQAAYNIYKKDGLQVDLHGQVAVEFRQSAGDTKITSSLPHWEEARAKTEYKKKVLKIWDWSDENGWVAKDVEIPLAGTGKKQPAGYVIGTVEKEIQSSDERTRLGYDRGASWLQIQGTQRINENMNASGTIGIGYSGGDYLYVSQANVSLDYRNLGSVSLGKQSLHSGYINRTYTYYPLDYSNSASARVDFTGVPNLHVSAYYLFPNSGDIRTRNNDITKGSGISGTYLFRFAPEHTLQLGAGYTNNQKNPEANYMNSFKKKAAAVSAEYKYRKLTLAADYGREVENYHTNWTGITEAKANSWGVKAGYDFTPSFRASVGYGQHDTKRNRTNMNAYVVTAYSDASFSRTKLNKTYVRADYDLRENVNLYGRVDLYRAKNYLGNEEYSKRKNSEITAGFSISF